MKKVEIKWIDSATIEGWRSDEEIKDFIKRTKIPIESIGYVYKKNKKYIVLMGDIGGLDGNARFILIPKCCIKSIKKIKS